MKLVLANLNTFAKTIIKKKDREHFVAIGWVSRPEGFGTKFGTNETGTFTYVFRTSEQKVVFFLALFEMLFPGTYQNSDFLSVFYTFAPRWPAAEGTLQ